MPASPRTSFAFTIVCLSIVFVPQSRTLASWPPGEYMAESMADNLALASTISRKSDYGFSDLCYLGAFLKPGNHSSITMELQQGKHYLFVGAARNAADLDILIEDENGARVAEDTQTDSVPAVEFSPTRTGRYTIKLRLYAATNPLFCGMVLMEKNSWNVPVDNLATATLRVLQSCAAVASHKPAKFLEEPGEWAMIGYILEEKAEMQLSEIVYGKGDRAVVAAGDTNAVDIDLAITQDNANDRLVGQDTDSDPNPVLGFESARGDTHSLQISNISSKGPTLVMIAQLDLD